MSRSIVPAERSECKELTEGMLFVLRPGRATITLATYDLDTGELTYAAGVRDGQHPAIKAAIERWQESN